MDELPELRKIKVSLEKKVMYFLIFAEEDENEENAKEYQETKKNRREID